MIHARCIRWAVERREVRCADVGEREESAGVVHWVGPVEGHEMHEWQALEVVEGVVVGEATGLTEGRVASEELFDALCSRVPAAKQESATSVDVHIGVDTLSASANDVAILRRLNVARVKHWKRLEIGGRHGRVVGGKGVL